jgi:alkylhydroperoxidase family enzyme
MHRLPVVNTEEGTPFFKTLANNPAVKNAFGQLSDVLENTLEPSLVEMIRLRVAANNACDY